MPHSSTHYFLYMACSLLFLRYTEGCGGDLSVCFWCYGCLSLFSLLDKHDVGPTFKDLIQMNHFHINNLDMNNNIKIHYAHIKIFDMNNNMQIKVCTNQRTIISKQNCKVNLMLNNTAYPLFSSDIIQSWFVSLVALNHIFDSTTYVDH